MKSDLPGESSKSRSKVNFTSAEVISWPSWNFTPCRSLKFHVSPSGLTCHDSASSGTTFMSGSKRTSWLYMRGERGHELRIEAGRLRGLGGDEAAPGLGSLRVSAAAHGQRPEGEAAHLKEPASAEARVVGAAAVRRHVMPP